MSSGPDVLFLEDEVFGVPDANEYHFIHGTQALCWCIPLTR